MAGSSAEWARYGRWNAAVAAVVFSREVAGTPVYLDLEDDVLEAIRDEAEPEADDPSASLADAVRGTLVLGHGPASVLTGHLRRLDTWYEGSMLDAPPTLALLALLSLAAETMHDGDGMGANNFYGRLQKHLGVDDEELARFVDAYRLKIDDVPASEALWESLNHWLEILEGNRGLPTARSTSRGHGHIAYPLSQALVRQTDRKRFGDLFAQNHLPPRSSLPAFDMENLIAEWMSRRPCPASNALERVWRSSADAQGKITEFALLALASWDGASESAPTGRSGTGVDLVRARAVLRTFPSRSLDVGLVVAARSSEPSEKLTVLDRDGTAIDVIEVVPVVSGLLGPIDPNRIDVASFLSGDVRLKREGDEGALRRRARRVVPMRFDDLLQAYIECERVQLGEESIVLVQHEVAAAAVELLKVVARSGFSVVDDLAGVPAGWTLITGVQVVASIPAELRGKTRVELNVLQPIASSQTVLEGGMKIPGNIPKWSTSLPPELRVSADAGTRVSATLRCTRSLVNPPPADRDVAGTGAVLIWNLEGELLGDGDYEIAVHHDGEPARVIPLRLRSADTPAVLFDDVLAPIVHDPETAGYGLIAARSGNEQAVRGVRACDKSLPSSEHPAVPAWLEQRNDSRREPDLVAKIEFPQSDESSCMRTGAHLMDLEQAGSSSTVEGVCRSCGLIKRYPARRGIAKRSASKKSQVAQGSTTKVNVGALPPVRPTLSIDWVAAFDAVSHVGAGPISALERIASQMDATDLFGDAFERKLELLGHIEIERDPRTMRPVAWEVVPPTLVGRPDGSAILAGFRSERMIVALEDGVDALGGTVTTTAEAGGPPIITIDGLPEPALSDLVDIITEAARRPAQYVARAAEQLAACLMPLSQTRQGLPKTTSISARSYERWDSSIARFVQAADAGSTGAFRLSSYIRSYIYRTSEDLGQMRATLGDARIVKYLAAADSGQTLLGYDVDKRVLYVPLGADLPGLYGRAAALASGCQPVENLEDRILEYRDVGRGLAGHLNNLLMT